jgi:hypothetical protein
MRRGRPPGVKNRRSLDLAKYIEATFAGMTPGQQSARIALVSEADVKAARRLASELGVIDLGLDALTLAMVNKATKLAKALRCEPVDAWAILAREREGLMKYVHQVQPQAREANNRPPATVFLVPEGEALAANASVGQPPDDDCQDPDFLDVFDAEAELVTDAESQTG